MLAGVFSGLGWFKRQSSRENSPMNPVATLMAGEGRRVRVRPEDSFGLATAPSPIQFKVLSAAEHFRNCRTSVERRCKARAFELPQRQRHPTRKAAP
jgi:hypothetical protein